MLSMNYRIVMPVFNVKDIGPYTLVSGNKANLKIQVTNDSESVLRGITVRTVIESYVGQEKPQLFRWFDPKEIVELGSKETAVLEYEVIPVFPGLASIAVYCADRFNNSIMAKRKTDANYKETPVRWWFNVADHVAVQTLMVLKNLSRRLAKGE